VFRDALAGLTNLGYSEDEARAVLDGVLQQEPDLDVAEALRKTLKGLAARRK
jgi:Holliday junction DNA helicase RuvA